MSLDVLHRAALGSTATLGTLYDARTDTFYDGISVLQQDIPPGAREVIDASYSNVQFVHSDSTSEKCSRLNIHAEIQVSILLGLFTLSGSGDYINNKKKSARSVRSSLIYNIRTKTEKLNVFHNDLKHVYSLDALEMNTGGTHFVSQIEWGANSMLMCEYENNESEDQTQIGGKLTAQLKKAALQISGSASVDFEQGNIEKKTAFKFQVIGDVLPDNDLPTTLEDSVKLMKQVPRLLNSSNSGKGKPISYTMLPVSVLKKYLEMDLKNQAVYRQIEGSTSARVVKYFEDLEAAEQKLFDLHSDVNNFRYCLQPDEIDEVVKFQKNIYFFVTSMKSRLGSIMTRVRSGESRKSIDELITSLQNHQFSPANITLQLNRWNKIEKKIQFARRVRVKGAKYIGSHGSVDNEIQDIYEKKLVILYMQENATYNNNAIWIQTMQLFFHEILLKPVEQDYVVVDCAFQPCLRNRSDTVIQVIQRGVVIVQDMLEDHKEFDGEPVVELESPKRLRTRKPSNELFPFTTHCPGLSCNTAAVYNWTCSRCHKTLRLGNDNYLYCDCGQTSLYNVSYKCSDPRHGLQFDEHNDEYILSVIESNKGEIEGEKDRLERVNVELKRERERLMRENIILESKVVILEIHLERLKSGSEGREEEEEEEEEESEEEDEWW